MLSKVASSTIFWVFGMTRPGFNPWSPGSLANANHYAMFTISSIKPGVFQKSLYRLLAGIKFSLGKKSIESTQGVNLLINILPRFQHGYPWPFLATLHHRLLSVGLRIGAELLSVGSSWSSCLCTSIWRGPPEYITYELVPTSPAESSMSGSSNFDSFRDGW